MTHYFDVHVFFAVSEGYSIPVEISFEDEISEDVIIQHCVENKLFSEEGDESCVDTVTEIDVDEYNQMKNN
jgi:hypothetical protein